MTSVISTRDVFGEEFAKAAFINKKILAIDNDLILPPRFQIFAQKFPQRLIQLGIAEQNSMSVAAGLASCGFIPFVGTIAVFATARAFDQIRQSIALSGENVKIVGVLPGVEGGEDGSTHHAIEDIALMCSIPKMTVVEPADASEVPAILKEIINMKGPVYLRLAKSAVYNSGKFNRFKIGKSESIGGGKDLGILACGVMVSKALEVSKALIKEDLECTVVNLSSIKPIAKGTILDVAQKTKAIVVAENHSIYGGLTSIVTRIISDNYPVLVRSVSINDEFMGSGLIEDLMEKAGLAHENLYNVCKQVYSMKTKR